MIARIIAVVALGAFALAAPVSAQSRGEVLFARSHGDEWDLFTIPDSGGEPTQLTDSMAAEDSAAYSPDGTRIAFGAFMARGSGSEIFVMNSDGSGVTQVTKGPFYKFFPQWSPDGTRLTYQATADLETDSMIYVINVDGTGKTRLTPKGRVNTQARWSPDGTRIAYDHSTHGSSDIYVMNPDGSAKTRLTESATFETWPAWSPDGTEIVFSRYRRQAKFNPYDMVAVDLSGNERVVSGIDNFSEEFPKFSPDGTMISFMGCRGTSCALEVIAADGSGRRTLVASGVEGPPPVWSPDSSRLAYTQLRGKSRRYDIFVVDVASGAITRLSDTRASDETLMDYR